MEIELPPDRRAPSKARQALREMEAVLGPELDAVELLATELVTNAVRHSGATDNEPIRLTTEMTGGCVRVTVTDPGPVFSHAPYTEDPMREDGRGLFLVEQVSSRWGIQRHGGNEVWFELEVPSNGGATAGAEERSRN